MRTTKEDMEDASGEGQQSFGLEKEYALNQARWRVGVGEIAIRVRKIRPPPFTRINPDQNWID